MKSAHRRVWLFDLDNTLHDANPHIFPHINRAMTQYVMTHLGLGETDADTLRTRYWVRYGATMLGLMRHHGVDPHHFLHHTHRFPELHRMVVFERALTAQLKRLPGRKVVFSNAPRAYILAVLQHMDALLAFDTVFGIEQLGLQPKPQQQAFRTVLRGLDVPAGRCILVDDTLANLRTAKKLGMHTVWVGRGLKKPAFVDASLRSILDLRRVAHLAR